MACEDIVADKGRCLRKTGFIKGYNHDTGVWDNSGLTCMSSENPENGTGFL